MREYTITRVSGPVDWSNIPVLPIDVQLWGTETDIKAEGKLCYDENALHVHLSAIEANIRAEENGPLASPCLDSCLEFFFSPIDGDSRYFNIEFSPTGCFYLGFGSDRYNLVRLVPEATLFNPVINRNETGWDITYSVPFAFIRQFFPEFAAETGKNIRANFYKCGDMTVKKHYLCWNPIEQKQPDYHLPAYFAPLYFG